MAIRAAALTLAAFALAAGDSAASRPLPPRPPDATYSYALRLGGAQVGTSTVVVHGRADGTILVKESASFSLPRFTATTTRRYETATLRETAYSGDFHLATGRQHVDVTLTAGSAGVVAEAGGRLAIPADPSAPLELVEDNLAAGALLIPAVLHASGAKTLTFAVLQGGKALVATLVAGPPPSRPAPVPVRDASLSLEVAGQREVYWYDPATYVVHEVAIPAQRAQLRLTATAAAGIPVPAPAPPAGPLPTPVPHFTSREIRFGSADGTVLAGTLTVPARGRPPFAAVVLVHGSGRMDRDATIGPNPIFLQLSNALSNAGYVVLRYDKRGAGKSGGTLTKGTRSELLDDVRAAYRFARAQREIAAKRIFLLGHSEGAELVSTVAAQQAGVAGIVLMAPASLPLWRVSLQQALASVPPGQRPAAQRDELAALAEIRRGSGAGDAWYRSSMDVDPAANIARVRSPVLILAGEGDLQMPVAALPRLVRAGGRDVTVRSFPGDNHLLESILAGEARTPEAAIEQELTVPARIDPRVVDALVAWLARQEKAPG